MQKTKKKRKGFTLTELAIVIAVIAILIAVLVPTFVSLINKANESADEQAVKSMNTSLASAEAIDGKPDNAIEAMAVLEADGFNVENYVALDSGNTIYYDLTYNRCLIWTTDENGKSSVSYPSDLASTYSSVTGVAANWYTFASIYNMTEDDIVKASTAEDLTTAISSAAAGKTVIVELKNDITLSTSLTSSQGSLTIDLNGKTLTTPAYSDIAGGATLYIKNGNINTGTTITGANPVYKVETGSSMTLEGVEVESTGVVLYPRGDSAQVNVYDSTINTTGGYCVSTNSSSDENYGVVVDIQNSTLIAKCSTGATAVMLNVAGSLNIDNCYIQGELQGVFVRAGTATITNSTIVSSQNTTTMCVTYADGGDKKWSIGTAFSTNGNGAAMGAVVVGDTCSTAYNADAIVTITNCKLSAEVTGTDADSYSDFAISLYVIGTDTTYKTEVTTSGCTMENYVVNWNESATLTTNYTGTIYSSYNSGWQA